MYAHEHQQRGYYRMGNPNLITRQIKRPGPVRVSKCMLTEISRKKYGLIYIIQDCVKINLAGVGGEWGMRARSNLTPGYMDKEDNNNNNYRFLICIFHKKNTMK